MLNGQVHAARNVTKTHTLNVDTFKAPDFGPLGVADSEAVRFYRAPLRRQALPLRDGDRLGRVDIVYEYAGADGRAIGLLLADGALDGLVIAALGNGHVSTRTLAAIRAVRARDIPVVVSTRVPGGRIVPMYANNLELKDLGCIAADNLSPQQARVLLMLALTRTRDPVELQACFER